VAVNIATLLTKSFSEKFFLLIVDFSIFPSYRYKKEFSILYLNLFKENNVLYILEKKKKTKSLPSPYRIRLWWFKYPYVFFWFSKV